MPPVVQCDPPVGAEYLVGSLQSYLTRRFQIQPVPLLENYRSNAQIVEYTRRLGYPRQLVAAYPETAIALLADPSALAAETQAHGLPWSDLWAGHWIRAAPSWPSHTWTAWRVRRTLSKPIASPRLSGY